MAKIAIQNFFPYEFYTFCQVNLLNAQSNVGEKGNFNEYNKNNDHIETATIPLVAPQGQSKRQRKRRRQQQQQNQQQQSIFCIINSHLFKTLKKN